MKQCTCFCKGWWPFLVLPLLLLLFTLLFKWRHIEEDVAKHVKTELTAAGYQNVDVEIHNRGRDVLLKGNAANQSAIEKIALATNGVRTVDFLASDTVSVDEPPMPEPSQPPVINLSPATLSVDYQSEMVVLSGMVNNTETAQSLYNSAVNVHGEKNVINELIVSDSIEQLPNIAGLFDAGNKLGDGNRINIDGNNLVLSGDVADQATKESVYNSINQLFDGQVINELIVIEAIPDPEATTPVTGIQCQKLLNGLLSAETINFDTAKASIQQSSFVLLDKLVAAAQRCPDTQFEVSGHTDASGSLAFNMSLSQQRAQVVVDYMTQAGLPTQRFTVKGYGPTKPIADNGSAEGRAKNRRIEFLIENTGD